MKLAFASLALLAAAAANASVTYHFYDIGQDFTLTTPTFITSTTTFTDSQFDSQSGFFAHTLSATFTPGTVTDTLSTEYFFWMSPSTISFDFEPGSFGAVGTYNSTSNSGTLIVTQSVPEPASLAALGLGALGLLKRRKRA